MIHEPTPEMEGFRIETRSESFYLRKGGPGIEDDGILVYLKRYPTITSDGYDRIEKAVRDMIAAEQRGDPKPVLNGWRIAARSACDGAVNVVSTGMVEIPYEDIPALVAALAQVCVVEKLPWPGAFLPKHTRTEPAEPHAVSQADSLYHEHI